VNPSRTLASRFRTQRTDRVRLEDMEVVSVFELQLETPSRIEVVVEQCRHDVPQGVKLKAGNSLLTPIVADAAAEADSYSTIAIAAEYAMQPLEISVQGTERSLLSIWNIWQWDGADQAWTGNSGLVIEDLPVPEHALRRVRLWCSDGLGNPSFDDMVVVVTVGPE